MIPLHRISSILIPILQFLVASCATTGSTLGSGVGDAYIEHPPFYSSASRTEIERTVPLGYLPISYQRGGSQAPIFDPSLSEPTQRLLSEMTYHLGSLGIGVKLAEGGRVSAVSHAATLNPPDVRFGCTTESGEAEDDCADLGEGSLGRGPQPMKLSVGRPSSEWVSWTNELMATAGVERLLLVTLEIGQYWVRQRGFAGSKVVELGTDHTANLPWFTSLETPVAVIQLTGALLGADGRALRIGAEGLTIRRTPLPISAIGGQTLITEEEVRSLRVERRSDLEGAPLVWQEALEKLVAQLTGGMEESIPSES